MQYTNISYFPQYFVPILLLWGMELVFLILFPVIKPIISSWTAWAGRASLAQYRGEKEEVNLITFVWNMLMGGLQCCGVQSYWDFTNNTVWDRSKLNLQVSLSFILFNDNKRLNFCSWFLLPAVSLTRLPIPGQYPQKIVTVFLYLQSIIAFGHRCVR